MVDLGVPRDIEPLTARLNDVYLYTIDDLRKVADESLDGHLRTRLVDALDRLRPDGGPAVGQIVAIDGRDHRELQGQLMHRLAHGKGQAYSDDSESLQADVMRFMAIIAFCLIAILALVKHAEPPAAETAAVDELPVPPAPMEVEQIRL